MVATHDAAIRARYSIARPSQLFATRDWRKEPVRTAPVSAICMFKDGIEPKWEDPANTTGGQWFCQVWSAGPLVLMPVQLCCSVCHTASLRHISKHYRCKLPRM
eukprot:SAG11_NODE_2837_length_2920_cov_2.907834_3_plen_104_part_00